MENVIQQDGTGNFYLHGQNVTKAVMGILVSGTMKNFDYSDPLLAILVFAIETASEAAEIHKSDLEEDFLNMDGMCPEKIRHFLNNICSNTEIFNGVRNYFEVGCGTGSTYISSNFKTSLNTSVVCDKFCEGKLGPDGKKVFLDNCKKYLKNIPENLITDSCFDVDLSSFKDKINLFLFDGPHEVEDHEKSLTYFEPIFDDRIIVMIDDWNDYRVQAGTILGLSKINYEVVFWRYNAANMQIGQFSGLYLPRAEVQMDRLSEDRAAVRGYSNKFGDPYRWHNGFMTMILRKRGAK